MKWQGLKKFIILLLSTPFAILAKEQNREWDNMVKIDSGRFEAFFKNGTQPEVIEIQAFYLDAYAVTNSDYLEFLKSKPQWQKDRASTLLAGSTYLQHWQGPLEPGPAVPDHAPVNFVSWFAARAYCAWKDKRLPTTYEWEYVAQASEDSPQGSKDEAFKARILGWYSRPSQSVLPNVGAVYRNYWGVYDMHGLIWEWVEDFNASEVRGDSRDKSSTDALLFCGAAAGSALDPSDYAAFMRYAMRSSLKGNASLSSLGFRCARNLK